jgi:hypothetical protein
MELPVRDSMSRGFTPPGYSRTLNEASKRSIAGTVLVHLSLMVPNLALSAPTEKYYKGTIGVDSTALTRLP